MQRTTAKNPTFVEIGKHSLLLTLSLVKLVFFFLCFYQIVLVEIYFYLEFVKISISQHATPLKSAKGICSLGRWATEVAVLINSRGTGGNSISLRHAGLFFLKLWTLLLAANRKLPDEPSSHAGAFRGCRVMARF